MRRLTDNAVRAKNILEREGAPLPPDCEQMLARDLERVLSDYFDLAAPVEVHIAREGSYVVTVRAEAARPRPFGVIK